MISHLDIRLNFFHRADDIGHSALEELAPQFRIKDENKLLTSDGSYLRKSREKKRNPEYELILIEEGKGLSFVGDSIQDLSPGDFMLIGKNLPHLWLSADEYYQNNIALEDIACNVGMNPSALCRYYKKHTGKRMFEYLTELRISYATKLLINKNINISQVAYDCGYNSLSHFNHQFKQVTGYTPSEYAQKL